MSYEVSKTLSAHRSLLQLKPMPLRHLSCKEIGKQYSHHLGAMGTVSPDASAMAFYGLNHVAALINTKFHRLETLPDWAAKIMQTHDSNLLQICRRMFYYMLMITTRESRHNKSSSMFNKIASKYGDECSHFCQQISGQSSGGAVNLFAKQAPNMPLGPYVDALVMIFNEGSWGGGFGGKKWGQIAETLQSCVNGTTSLEMLVDTSFTLSHNNGPIFNKGMVFDMYTSEIIKILDVQRSGQIPEAAISGELTAMPTAITQLMQLAKEQMPNDIGSYVDWFKVEKLGAVKQYSLEKKKQTQKHGVQLIADGPGMHETGTYVIWPGQTLTIMKRKAA
jgi:hypothetical protein